MSLHRPLIRFGLPGGTVSLFAALSPAVEASQFFNTPNAVVGDIVIASNINDRTFFQANNITVNGVISGGSPGYISVTATGTTFANPANTYIGNTVLGPGATLSVTKLANIGEASSLGREGSILLNTDSALIYTNATEDSVTNRPIWIQEIEGSTTPGNGAQHIISVTNANRRLTLNGGIFVNTGGYNDLTKEGAGTLVINQAEDDPRTVGIVERNNFWHLVINGGTVETSDLRAIGFAGQIINNGARLRLTGGVSLSNGGLILGAGGGVVDVAEGAVAQYLLGVQGSSLIKEGGGALYLASGTGIYEDGSYSGGTTIRGGMLVASMLADFGQRSSIGTGNVTIENDALLVYNGSADVSVNRTLTLGPGGGGLATTGADLTWSGTIIGGADTTFTVTGGRVILSTAQSTAARTVVQYATLRAIDGFNLPSGNLQLLDGVLESSGTFSRNIGFGAGEVSFVGTSGFSAVGGDLSVMLNGHGGAVDWPSADLLSELILNDSRATHTLTLHNSFDTEAGKTRTIRTEAGLARLVGGIGGEGTLVITGGGTVEFAGGGTGDGALRVENSRIRGQQDQLPTLQIVLQDSVLQSSGELTRPLGDAPGTLTLRGESGFSAVGGDLTVNLGGGATLSTGDGLEILRLNDAAATGTLNFHNDLQLDAGTTLTLRSDGGAVRVLGVIGGEGDLVVKNGQHFELVADNTHTGSTTFDGGTFAVGTLRNLGEASPIGAGLLKLRNGVDFAYTGDSVSVDRGLATLDLVNAVTVSQAATTLSLGGAITGNVPLLKRGTGTLELRGDIAMNGSIEVEQGILVFRGSPTGSMSFDRLKIGNVEWQTGTVRMESGNIVTGTITPQFLNPWDIPQSRDEYTNDSVLGYAMNTYASVLVTGADTIWDSWGNITVGYHGGAELTVAGGARVLVGTGDAPAVPSVTSTIYVGRYGVHDTTLNIGGADLLNPTTGGAVEARQIILTDGPGQPDFVIAFLNYITRGYSNAPSPSWMNIGAGGPPRSNLSRLNFNQTDTVVLDAAIGGFGLITQRGTGTTILNGDSETTNFLYRTFGYIDREFVYGPPTLHTLGFHGDVLVEAGTLLVNGRLTAVTTTVKNGGTLGGTGLITGIHLEEGGILSPGVGLGTLSSDTLTWDAGGRFVFDLGAEESDQLVLTGALTKNGEGDFLFTFVNAGWEIDRTYRLIDFADTTFSVDDFGFTNGGGFGGIFHLENGTLSFTLQAVPEPAAFGFLAGVGALAVTALRRRRGVAGSR